MFSVLFLINNLGNGGAERVLVNLVNNMDHSKFNVTLRTLVDEGENKKKLSNKINYEYTFKKGFRGLNYLHLLPKKFIYNKVAHGEYDVIIVYLQGVLTKIVSYAPENQKTIAYLHANMEKSAFMYSFKNKYEIQKCFNTYNKIVSVSKDVRDSFELMSHMEENTKVIYNTFNVEEIKSLSQENILTPILDEYTLNICSVGKLEKVKGYDRLLSIVKTLKNEGLNFTLTIIGEGSMKRDLKTYITKNDLESNVNLVGFDSNPYKYISKSDLFVCSSYSEGFSSVIVESIILGVPVITTKCAGMTEILGENNEYGIIVPNTEEDLYLGLKDIIKDKDKLAAYKNKAFNRSNYFKTKSTVSSVESLIDEVISAYNTEASK